jgi:hypothetical protein
VWFVNERLGSVGETKTYNKKKRLTINFVGHGGVFVILQHWSG